MKEKFKYLFKNFGLLLIGNFSSKILSFLLVPLYTATLTTEEYGIYDIIYDTILLFIPIVSLNITDAIVRFMLDSDDTKKCDVIAVANKYIMIACCIFFVGVSVLRCNTNNSVIQKYFFQIIVLFISVIVQQYLVQAARGLEKIKNISICGVLGTVTAVAANIYFLVIKKYGLNGYFAANILSLTVQSLFLLFSTNLFRTSSIRLKRTIVEKEMLLFCIPLMATTLSWHINSIADRYVVTVFEGLAMNGIYAVSYKIPTIMTTIQTIFIQSWQLSAIKEFHSEEGKRFINKTYIAVQTIMILLCCFTIFFTRFLARMLFQAKFYEAWICVPTLVFYVLFNTMSGALGGIFSAVKDTKTFMYTAIVGAITNIILNFAFVLWLGILGAAISTAISSIVIWGLRLHAAKKYVKIDFMKNNGILQMCLLITQAAVMTVITAHYGYMIQMFIIACILICNKNEVSSWVRSIKRK